MKRPSAMIHMALWGAGLGWLGAAVYIILVFVGFGGWQYFTWGMLGELLRISALFGGVVGTILGIIDGAVLSFLLRDLDGYNFDEIRKEAQWKVAAVTGLGMIATIALLLGLALLSSFLLWLPILIASMVAYFAVGNYFKRLEKLPMEKLKNDGSERLEDKLKNDESYDSELEVENRKNETS